MRITSATFYKFKRFSNSNITKFHARFESPVTVICSTNGSGKMEANNNLIKIPGGWKRMGDIVVGDLVMTRDGSYTKVLGVFPQGKQQLYLVTFVDGRQIKCGKEHLWSIHIQARPPQERVVLDTEFLRRLVHGRHVACHIDTVMPEQSEDINLPIHPYLLGVLLGDGSIISSIELSTDKWIIEKVSSLLPDDSVIGKLRHDEDKADYFYKAHVISASGQKLFMRDRLKQLGLFGHNCYTKFIPESYLNASHTQRLELLQGLLDTDGYVGKLYPGRNGKLSTCGIIEFSTSSEQLAKDVAKLIWSLGGICKTRIRTPFFTHQGVRKAGATNYRLNIRLRIPGDGFTLPRKRERMPEDGKNQYSDIFKLKIANIEILPIKEECTCIYVEHPEHLYVTENYIVTHNTSLLKELVPLPSTRTDYGPGGFKELHIEHNSHQYILGSYFENKQSPHSFKVDGVELNTTGTTEVQLELVEKHFGINNVIRNLITSKIQMSSLTRAGRKDLLLHANPMDLGLILDTHKKAQAEVKNAKAQLQMLYLKKQDLEGKLIPQATLIQHKDTQTKLNNQLLALDKIIYGLEQHIRTLQDRFRTELEYKDQCTNNNQQLIPSEQILAHCQTILRNINTFTHVQRGDTYQEKREELHSKQSELNLLIEQLKSAISSASQEINEYTQHLDRSADRPISTVEKEIAEIDAALSKYEPAIENPVPQQNIKYQSDLLEEFQKILFVFRDCEVKLITPNALNVLKQEFNQISNELHDLANTRQRRLEDLKTITEDLEKRINSAGIPKGCVFQHDCGLANVFSATFKSLQDRKTEIEEYLNKTEKPLKELESKYAELSRALDPIETNRLPEMYSRFKNYLSSFYYHFDTQDDDALINKLNNQPLSFYNEIKQHLENSKLTHERKELENKKQGLTTELQALMKSGGASLEFMQRKLKEKEVFVKTSLDKLKSIEEQKATVDQEYSLYVEYAIASDKLKEFQNIYSKGEKALLVSKAIEYWKNLGRICLQVKSEISEELRKIESIVREQETTAHVYREEIAPMIATAEKNRRIYEKLELALSPTTGIPHRSMVKYLNALINNVNAFVQQMWTYRMKLFNVREDEPLDYNFRLEIKNEAAGDINVLSKGQKEVMDLAWILTILLQLRMLNNVPLFGDELGSSLDTAHRNKLIKFLGQLLDNKLIDQIFLVSHFALFTDGFSSRDIVCLNSDNLNDLPQETNRLVTIE